MLGQGMNEELEKIEKNNTWELVPRPHDKSIIGTKWIFKNKLNENGQVSGNKARLVYKGYAQQEDVDWEGSVDDRKSTSGGAFYTGSKLVSWFNKKQSSIALSIAEAKYVVAESCCTQLLWMMKTLQDIQITCTPPISILCDNTSAISISKNPDMHSKTKHIPIKYDFLREQVPEQKVKLEYVPSKEYVVDIFAKPLPRETF
eukprot:PITA_12369